MTGCVSTGIKIGNQSSTWVILSTGTTPFIRRSVCPTQGGLEPLRARGGKVIQYHGLGDVMSPTSSMFYDTLVKTMGYEKTQSFYKLYLVPGMGHCGGGIGCYDRNTNLWFLPLVDWVEKGIEPKLLLVNVLRLNI